MAHRITTNQVTERLHLVNAKLSAMGKPLQLNMQIWNTPTQVKFMSDGGTHYFSQTMSLRESYEALSLLSYTLENMDGKEMSETERQNELDRERERQWYADNEHMLSE